MDEKLIEEKAYKSYSYDLFILSLRLPKNRTLTKDQTLRKIKQCIKVIQKERKEESLLIKLLYRLGIKKVELPSKHDPRYYTFAILLMDCLGKECLSLEDIDIAKSMNFYERFFKKDWVEHTKLLMNQSNEDISKEFDNVSVKETKFDSPKISDYLL